MENEKLEEDSKNYSEYLCKKCGEFFLEKDFNLEKGLCKNCWNMEKKREPENVGSRVIF